ncbi:MAG: Hint domain-containing protein, partial [Amylibacter sp.]
MAVIVITTPGTYYVGDNDKVVIKIPGGGEVTLQAYPNETVNNFTVSFEGDDHSDHVIIDLPTFSADDLQIDIKQYDPTDIVTLIGSTNGGVDPDDSSEFDFEYVGADGETHTGFIHAKDGSEQDFTSDPSPITICFTPGTLIATPRGAILVEDLRVDDLVITADNGLQAVRWIGRKRITGARLMAYPKLRPIRIRKDAFGPGIPHRDMHVSPQHRMLIDAGRVLINHGERKVLAPAKGLINDYSITVDYDIKQTEYIHLLFDRHEIIFANGAATESFHPGHMAMSSIDEAPRTELFEVFPELQN